MIWKQPISLEATNQLSQGTMNETLGIEFVESGPDYLIARMPVDRRTVQPFGILHGGASATLAETIGSVASFYCLETPGVEQAVGIELNISHLRSAGPGYVFATVRPCRIGRKVHVWSIEIRDERERLISVSRLTMAVVNRGERQD